MGRPFLVAACALTLTGWLFAIPSSADGPTSTPTASPSPAAPSPASGATASPPSASGSPSPSPTDSTATSASAPDPGPTPDPEAARAAADAARARDAALLANARSLAQIIEAQARVAQDELAALDAQTTQVGNDLDDVNAEIAALQAKSAARGSLHDRLERDALRLAQMPAGLIPRDLTAAQREALDELRSLQHGLAEAQARLADRAEMLARLTESVGAKQAQLARQRDRARTLAAAAATGDTAAREARVAVLQGLAQEATAAQMALAQLVASAMVRDGTATPWSLPLRGPITQSFGPTTLEVEPAMTYRGTYYAHFHAAIDIAAPLGSPVSAAANGIVTFVGHLPDGAMIVLIAHAGGLVSEYAHLDDTFALPPVKVGQTVNAGQVIGFVGLSGTTTGPHVHFAVLRGGEPADPLSVIATAS